MNILEFTSKYPNEVKCREHFREQREKEGIKCKHCGNQKHYWLSGKSQWQCSKCNFRTTLRSGTIMEHSKLPIRMWYLAMAFMSQTKKGLSACELQRQLQHKRYESIWNLMHKIRMAMGNRDNRYKLDGMIEMDEAFVETTIPDGTKLKRGKGSQRQQNIAVFAESTPLEDIETGKLTKHCRYFKMKVLENHKSIGIKEVIAENVGSNSVMFTDKSSSYIDFTEYVEEHIQEKSSKITTSTTLRWVHIAIANAKRNLLGVHHRINREYLKNYLDEFCYKLNRRWFSNKFERLTLAIAMTYW